MREATQTVVAMNHGVPLVDDDSEFTSRGLEYMTPDGFDITTSSLDVVKLVLEEQTRQRDEPEYNGELDTDLLAATVGGVSRHRSRIAHLAAMKDARGVYGEGNFKLDPLAVEASAANMPIRSRSFDGRRREPRRGMLKATGSMGAAAEKTRRRRGSRGLLQHSAPDAVTGTSVAVPEKSRNSFS